jgi:REP element-mobilizing transposase RayT
MPRPLRLHIPGALYHVTLRGNHQQDIFFTTTDRLRMNDLFSEVLQKFGARLHAYCYMTNHLHALIQVGVEPLGRLMLRVAGQYARMTQARLQTTGHLFEKRYYPVLVDTDAYLLELIRYVHLNPVRAKMVTSPAEYPWTSHHTYLGKRIDPWVTTDLALSTLASERGKAVQAYEALVRQAQSDPDLRSPLEQRNPNDPRILGSDDFARRVIGPEWKPRSRKSLDQLIAECCERFAVSPADLASPRRDAKVVAARVWVVKQAVEGRIASLAAVARRFNRDESSLRRATGRRSTTTE